MEIYNCIYNSKIKFVLTWCVFELQKPQVVFDSVLILFSFAPIKKTTVYLGEI